MHAEHGHAQEVAPHDLQDHGHDHGSVIIVVENFEGHLQAHLDEHAVDLDQPGNAPGKIPFFFFLLALVAAGIVLQFQRVRTTPGFVRWQVPITCASRRWLPPSQAPPSFV